jgi:hydrogenase nickel incorporation protein HypA/HybF
MVSGPLRPPGWLMHELGIMQRTIELALEAAGREQARKITSIRMQIGTLAGVVPDALEFAFDVVTRGTPAEGARLEWDQIPVRCRCPYGCGEFEPTDVVYVCPVCRRKSWEIVKGRELNLLDIEIEA